MADLKWRLRAIWLGLTMKPMAGADDDDDKPADKPAAGGDDDKPKGDADDDSKPKGGDAGDDDDSGSDDRPYDRDKPPPDDDVQGWKRWTRRHENEAKKARREVERLRKEAEDRAKQDQTEQEKAVAKAREEGESKATQAAEAERRKDRLENAVIRTAAKGIRIGEGDEAKTVRFRDPEDALLHLERAVASGDVDEEDLFNDKGRINADVLQEALTDIIDQKSYLRAEEGKKEPDKPEPKGSGDGGKGGSDDEGGKSIEDMSPEEHYERIRRHKPKSGETVRSLD